MAYPIITLLIGAGMAFLAFQTNSIDTGMEESAPAVEESAAPAGDEASADEEAAGDAVEEEAAE